MKGAATRGERKLACAIVIAKLRVRHRNRTGGNRDVANVVNAILESANAATKRAQIRPQRLDCALELGNIDSVRRGGASGDVRDLSMTIHRAK